MISLLWGNYLLLRAFRTASLNLFFGDDREIIFLISIPFFPSTVYCYWPFFPYPIKCQVINYLIARSLSRFRLLGFRVPVFCTISLIIKIHRNNYFWIWCKNVCVLFAFSKYMKCKTNGSSLCTSASISLR